MMVAAFFPPVAFGASLAPRTAARWVLRSVSSAAISGGGGESSGPRRLVLYTKPGCCLCDGLKEKLHAAISLVGPHPLGSVEIQVRNILENPEWERMYQYEIPVLARVLPDGTEETLPRLSPRLGVELIQKKIAAALEQ